MEEKITFSFGENWRAYLETISEESIRSVREDIENWLGAEAGRGKKILDIGCGSGIHSLIFHQLGAKELVSFDADPISVESTTILREKAGSPSSWKVMKGSVLDKSFIANNIGGAIFDIVYSWGVLHHTGSMWRAIENSSSLVKKGGLYWIALYRKGPRYE
ncbi:MAG: class I SAM-dependent methyltransferase, partial [Desulfobacterales bacterium]|nr:class I SAM-dependent methyltransferase [Desulfobacterales bacterium]